MSGVLMPSKLLLMLLAILAIGPCALAAQPSVVRGGSELEFRPYAFTDPDGRPTGFGVELLKAVADEMGLPLQIHPGPWDRVWSDLVAGRIDVLPVVARTPGRESLVDFSLPHTETFDAFFVRKGRPPIRSIADAAGKAIVVVRSDVAQHHLIERGFAGTVVPVENIPEGLRLIAAGRYDAMLCSKVIGVLEREQADIEDVEDGPPIPDYKRIFSFAVRKGDAELLAKLDQGLRIVKADGTYDRLYRKWLGVQGPPSRWQTSLWQAVGLLGVFALIALTWLAARQALKLEERPPPGGGAGSIRRYGLAFLAVTTGYAVRVGLEAWIGPGLPLFITYFPAVMVAALLGGIGPGLVATTLAAVVADITTMPPLWTLGVAEPVDRLALALFFGIGLFLSSVAELYRRTRARATDLAREEARREGDERLRYSLEACRIGAWDLDLSDRTVARSPVHDAIFGYPEPLPRWTLDDLLGHLLPQYRARVETMIEEAASSGTAWTDECRIRRADGEIRWIWLAGRRHADPAGRRRVTGVVQDITERKVAETALRESEKKYRNLFENMAEEVHFWELVRDETGRIRTWRLVDANPPAIETWGRRSIDEIRGKGADEIFGPGATEHYLPVVEKIFAEGLPHSFEDFFPNLNRYFQFTNVPLGDHFITTGADITAIKSAERALRVSEREQSRQRAFLETLLDNSDVCIAVMRGPELRYALANRAYRALRPDVPLLGRRYREVFPDAVDTGAEALVQRVIETGEPQEDYGYAVPIPGKPDAAWDHRIVRLPPTEGEEASALILTWDVTKRVRALDALRKSREGLRRLADASLAVMAKTDLGEMLQALSQAALALTGGKFAICAHSRVDGQPISGSATRPPDAQVCPPGEMFRQANGGVHLTLMEGAESIRLTDADLRTHPRWWGLPAGHAALRGLLGVPMRGRNGQPNGMLLVTDKDQGEFTAEDETLIRQLATVGSLALQHVEARLSLEGSDRRKDEFLAMLGHELRNPLAPIRNSLHILERAEPDGEQARRAQATIDRQVEHLTRLVDDLLDVTRISRGKIRLRRERLNLCDLVRRAVEDYREAIAGQGLELELSLPEDPLWIGADPTRIVQVVGNLLGNALKFTPAGGKVSVALERQQGPGQAVLTVRDTGVGLTPEMLGRVFEPFAQADTTLERSRGGLGLGLAMAKGLVELHGGSVSMASPGPGHGCELSVRLPVGPAEPLVEPSGEPPSALTVPDGIRRRILIVEDNPDSAESLRMLLELSGHSVDVAATGPEGVSKARERIPETVLCDIGLPGMDGFAVARALRQDARLNETLLVALSGYADPETVAKAREAGFDTHLAKPLGLGQLEAILAQARRERG